MKKIIVFSAPSGSGKTTIINHLMKLYPQLTFSVSATSRAPRGIEQHGVDYFFFSDAEFKQKVTEDAFVEWEEVYSGTCYGTLKSEIERVEKKDQILVLDLDVQGALKLKKQYPSALLLFIQPPSINVLELRLRARSTDTEAAITKRIEKAAYELSFAKHFDKIVINDNLDVACQEAQVLIKNYLQKT